MNIKTEKEVTFEVMDADGGSWTCNAHICTETLKIVDIALMNNGTDLFLYASSLAELCEMRGCFPKGVCEDIQKAAEASLLQ